MRLCILLMLATMIGCSAGVTQNWYVNGRSNNQVACFDQPEGLYSWKRCSEQNDGDKSSCEVNALLTYHGTILAEKTTVKVHVHTPAGYSIVQLNGEKMFCPTIHVRK
jgi:hypothetical protein